MQQKTCAIPEGIDSFLFIILLRIRGAARVAFARNSLPRVSFFTERNCYPQQGRRYPTETVLDGRVNKMGRRMCNVIMEFVPML